MVQSGLEASSAAAFLQENMLEFVDPDAMEDAAEACLYLSHAGHSKTRLCPIGLPLDLPISLPFGTSPVGLLSVACSV